MAKKAGAAAEKKVTGVATKEVNPELVILSPEQYEQEIEKKISGEIQKYNLADSKIAEMKKKYSTIKVEDISDKLQVKVLKEALSDVVSTRRGIDKKKVEINSEYIRMQKAVNGEAKRLTELVLEVEQPLKEEKQRVDDLEKAEREKQEKEDQEKLENRVSTLKENGMQFDGNFYCIGNMSMDIVTIKSMKDSDFDFLVAKVGLEAERIRVEKEREEQLRIQEEKARQEQAEKDRIEREKFEADKKKMDEERAAFARQQEEFAEQKRKHEHEQEQMKAEAKKVQTSNRSVALEDLGYNYRQSTKQFLFEKAGGSSVVDMSILETATTEYFLELIEQKKVRVSEINKATTEIEEENAELHKKEAIAQQKREDEAKAKADQEEAEKARIAEEKRKAELPEAKRVSDYILELIKVEQPEVSTPVMKQTLEAATAYIFELQKSINDYENGLK